MQDWPTCEDYDRAIVNRLATVLDEDIKYGELKEDDLGPIRLNPGGGKYTCLYKVGEWVVRCIANSPPTDFRERYQAITSRINRYAQELWFLEPPIWVDQGIQVNNQNWPFIKLRYVTNSKPLGAFLSTNQKVPNFRQTVQTLAEQWLQVVSKLEAYNIVHGDLDATNVLVIGTYPNVMLKLIDFDGMYVPELAGRDLLDDGHEHFQPANLDIRQFNQEMDRFSALVIYISLLGLTKDASLWRTFGADEASRLLLGAEDYTNPEDSDRLSLLERKGDLILQACISELRQSIHDARMPRSLSTIVADAKTQAPARPIEPLPLPVPIWAGPQPLPPLGSPVQRPGGVPPQTGAWTSGRQMIVDSPPFSVTPSGSHRRSRAWVWVICLVILTILVVGFLVTHFH